MKKKMPICIVLENTLLQRELSFLMTQMESVTLVSQEQEDDLVVILTDKTDQEKHHKNMVILIDDLPLPIDKDLLKQTLEKAYLKKAQEQGKLLRIGSLIEIDRYERELRLCPNDRFVTLTEKEIDILEMLWRAKGDIVTKEKLLQDIWRYHVESETHTVETHIYRLRQKLSSLLFDELILTELSGYRLNTSFIEH